MPEEVEPVMGDIMMVLRVPLADLCTMDVLELMRWHEIAAERWRLMLQMPRMV